MDDIRSLKGNDTDSEWVNTVILIAVIVAVHCHCESSPGSSDECSTQRQVATDPLDQADQPEPIDPPIGSYSDYIHHRHSLLLSLKADTQFNIPQRVEGWVDLASWLRTEMVHLPADSHPSKY